MPSEHLQDRGREQVVAGQPGVLHSEQGVVQLTGHREVGRHEPVPVAVFERLRHLRRRQDQHGAQREQAGGRRRPPQAPERAATEPSQRHDLDELYRAQRRDREEADREQRRIESDQPLVHPERNRRRRERAEAKQALDRRAWVADAHVRLVAPLLPALDDPVLRRAHELTSTAGCACQGDQCVERHAGPDHLAEKGRRAGPPPPALPRLRHHEADPRRYADHDRHRARVRHVPRHRELLVRRGDQEQGIARELDQHHGPHPIGDQVHRGLELHAQAIAAAQHRHQQVEGGLKASGRPTRLLTAVGVDRDGKLLGHYEVLHVRCAPAAKLGTVAEVQVFGESGGAPPARVVDGLLAPHARSTREVGEESFVRAHGLLDEEVEVDGQRLQAREPRIAFVHVSPSRLREPDAGVIEDAHDPAQEVLWRDEVGVEDGDEGRGGQAHAVRERARLEAFAHAAPDVGDVDPFTPPVRRPAAGDVRGLVVRVVQHLHLEAIARPFHPAHRIDHALGNVALVVDRDLHAHGSLGAGGDRRPRRSSNSRRAPAQVQQVDAKAQEGEACRGEHADRDPGDHVEPPSSNKVYGRMVARTYATRARASGLSRRVHCM